MAFRDFVARLLGVSAYTQAPLALPSLGSREVDEARERYGGGLVHPTATQTRWYIADIEAAIRLADEGWLSKAAQLMRAARADGVLAGVMSTRTDGLVRLPKRFVGHAGARDALERGHDETRSVFDEMAPATELALLARDGIELGIAVGELVEVEGRAYPVLVRHSPEFLRYRWDEARWYFRSVAGELPITPGDGRWVLHTPGGRQSPWQQGLWTALGGAFVRKTHARLHKDNWEAKLANPARVAVAPQGATEPQKQSWFRAVMAWGVNTVFGLTPGYDVKLLESNGRGWESFDRTIEDSNREFVLAVAGQTVTTDGGTGFANADVHKSIRADLIKGTADALAFTVNTQILPQFILRLFGEEALAEGCTVEWDVTPPKDHLQAASALTALGSAISTLDASLAPHGMRVDARTLIERFGVPFDVAPARPSERRLELVQGAA